MLIRNRLIENLEKAVLTCDQAERETLTNFIIVGGGPTGVELAGALAEFKRYILEKDYPEIESSMMNIYLIEMLPHILPGLSEFASGKAEKTLDRLGVTILPESKVHYFDGQTVITGTGEQLTAQTLIWAAGVQANVPKGLPEDIFVKGSRIRVDEYSKITGMNDIFAIGDVAAMINKNRPKGHPMVATVAIQQGATLGKQFLKLVNNSDRIKPFRYKDKGMLATIGKTQAVADLKHLTVNGFIAWLIWATVHLYYMVGVKNKLVTVLSWFYHYLTYDKANRHIFKG